MSVTDIPESCSRLVGFREGWAARERAGGGE